MNKIFLISTLALGLFGCDLNLSGSFQLSQNMNILTSEGKPATLPAGTLAAEFKVKDKSIKVNMPSLALEMMINMNKAQRRNLEGGRETLLPAATSGQPFDVLAQVTTRTLNSRTYYDTAPCTYYVYQTVCDSQGRCTLRSFPVRGWQYVKTVAEDRQSAAMMKIFRTGTQDLLSTASAQTAISTYTYNTEVGSCR